MEVATKIASVVGSKVYINSKLEKCQKILKMNLCPFQVTGPGIAPQSWQEEEEGEGEEGATVEEALHMVAEGGAGLIMGASSVEGATTGAPAVPIRMQGEGGEARGLMGPVVDPMGAVEDPLGMVEDPMGAIVSEILGLVH